MTDKTDSIMMSETPAQILHDIITPLLVAKINVNLLAEHLPSLLIALKNSQNEIPLKDEKTLEALLRAPEIIANNIDLVQRKYRALSASLFDTAAINQQTVAATTNSNGSKISTILLVDDETIHQDIGIKLLSPYYKVDSAQNGIEAISKCKLQHYDLILMDLQMPKMNGASATEELRKFIKNDTIIIGLTSMPLGEKRIELLNIGFNDFLEKPLKLDNFQNLVQSFLS